MDIRLKTCLIIRRGSEYLVGINQVLKNLNWSPAYFDAWRTRDLDAAQAVAEKVGGVIMLFNPVTGQLKGV